MGKNGDYPSGAKVYESKKEKKRRLVMNSDSESEEFVITPRVEIVHAGNGAASGRRNKVLEKGGGKEKMVTRGEVLRRKFGSEGSKGKIFEAMSDRKSREIGVDEPDGGDIKSGSVDSVGNQTDTIGGSSNSLVSLKLRYKFTGSAKEKFLESKSDRKRSMEIGDDEFIRKKTKTENMDSVDNDTEKSGERNKSLTIVKHGDKIMDSRKDGIQISKLPVPRAKQRDEDGSSERNFQPILKTSSKAEAIRWLGQSGQSEPQQVNDARFSDVGTKKEEEGGSSHHSYIRMQGKSGALRVLQGSRKAGSENSNVQCKGQGKTRRLRSSGTNRFSMSNHQLERQVDEKSVSNIKLGKSSGKVSSEVASKSSVSKVNQETTSQKKVSSNMDLLHSKSGFAAKEKKNTNASNQSRSTAKNKIREQIKSILIDAGWRIEFRPRRDRDYEDAVYVSPQGSGYWSITKAYDVYVRQFQSTCDVKESSGKQPKASTGRDSDCKEANSTYVVIPPEVLLMLKRNVVNKRRRKKEMEDVKRKVGVGRKKKKAKEITKVKRPKDKGTRNDVGGTRAIKRKVINKRGGCALLVRGSNQDEGSEKGDYAPYVWKRTVISWMIDLGVMPAYGKVSYMNKRMTRALLDGRLTRDGIQCSCCSKVLTVSKFESHAGSKLHQPYENIYLEVSGISGISLLQCQINAWEKQESERCNFYDVDTDGDDPNDDTCGICGDGGDLICCDSCPSTFHLGCLGIEMLPTGDWHCTNCSCKFCGAVHDFASQDGNASNALFTCSQCAQKYHKECVPEGDTVSIVPNSSCNVFCGRSCRKVFRKLQKLSGVRNELEAGFYWSIIRRFDEPSKSLSRMAQRVECNSKIAVAYAVMDECFVPITDQRSGINLIHNVVYNCGSNFNRLNFSGFYTFILERGDEIIAAASVRIHDTRLAEMPFIGTRSMYRRQGMCRRLLKGIESALRSLCVKKLIIPAISELTDTWTTVFGFKPLGISQKQELNSVNMLVFPGTGLLQKSLLKDSTKKHTNPEPEKKPETQISVNADKNYSPDEIIDSKKSNRDAEAIKPNIPVLEHSTNFLLEASGCHAQFCRPSDSAADGESNDLKSVVSFNNHVEKDISMGKCLNEVVACIEEPKKELEDVTDALPSLHYPASELLHGASGIEASEFRPSQNENSSELPVTAYVVKNCISAKEGECPLHGASGIEALEFRPSQNENSSELPVTDVVNNCNPAKEGECPLGFLQKLKDKPPGNGITHDVSPKKCEFIEADEDREHDINEVKLRHDANGLESNVNEERIEVSVDVIRVSELLHGASGIEASEFRPPQNEYNSELSVTDVVSNCNSEKEGECPLGSLLKLKDKPPNNAIEHGISPKKCGFIEADEDRAHGINEVNLRHDADGLESNVNDESIEVSIDIIRQLNTSLGKGSYASSGVCGNGSGSNPKHYSVASNEKTSQEKLELSSQEKLQLLKNQVKCYVEANDSTPLDQLAVSYSAKPLDAEGVSGFDGANSATSEGLLSKLKESAPCINQNFSSTGEVGDDCHDDVCDVSIAENDAGVVESVHDFELSSVSQASKMVT